MVLPKRPALSIEKGLSFDSQTRDNTNHNSDIDIFLDVKEGFSLFDLCELTDALEKRFGVSCDVITRNGLKDSIRSNTEKMGFDLWTKPILQLYFLKNLLTHFNGCLNINTKDPTPVNFVSLLLHQREKPPPSSSHSMQPVTPS